MKPIYLDHAAATPLRPAVRSAMAPLVEGIPGNPSSVHGWGREARRILERARERVASCLGVEPGEVVFTRGGTESVNLAVLGRVDHWAASASGAPTAPSGRLIRSAVEHSAVREAMDSAESRGWTVDVWAVGPDGSIVLPDPIGFPDGSPERARADDAGGRRPPPALVSVQWVNQETGLVLPVAAVAEWADASRVPLHVDAVQAVGLPGVEFGSIPIGLASLSGHKLGGPRSTGVLVARDGIELYPRLFGGGQERALRPGTEDVAGAEGFTRALEIVLEDRDEEAARLGELRDRLESGLRDRVPGLRVHGGDGARAPHILNVGIEGIPRDVLPKALDLERVGASAGSACRSGSTGVSPVLEALYGPDIASVAPLRLSLGWTTTAADIEEAIRRIPPVVERVASLGVGA